MTDLRAILASNVKLYRKSLGLTQEKLAEMINISYNYVALIETGRRFPSLPMLERIADALQKDTLELLSIKKTEIAQKKALKAVLLADIEKILTTRFDDNDFLR